MFAYEHWGVQPDLITLAKGLTSGYLPLGACVASTKVFNAFLGDTAENKEFVQVCTYGGHPVACAAGIANLKILQEERLWENAEKVGTHLLSKLETLRELPIVGDVRGKGLLLGVELIETDGTHLKTAKTNRIVGQLRDFDKGGIIVGKIGHAVEEPESIIFIAPPLILTEAEADRIFETLREVLVQQEF